MLDRSGWRSAGFVVWAACASALTLSAAATQSSSPPPDKTPQGPLRARERPLPKPLRLRAEPERLAAGEPVTVLGADFGEQPRGHRLLLQLADGSEGAARVPVPIERWTRKAISARMPRKGPARAAKADLLLVDAKGRVLGRAAIVLSADEARRAESDRRKQDESRNHDPQNLTRRREGAGPKDERPDPAALRLFARPNRVGAGDSFTVTGADFGESSKGRLLYLQVRASRPVLIKPLLTVESWTRQALEVRVPDKLHSAAESGPAVLLLVDEGGRVLGRGDMVLSVDEARRAEDEERSLHDDPTGLGVRHGQRLGNQADMFGDQRARQFPSRPGLALGGGGAKGAFQVGVLKNLYARGLSPVIITGTSVGALNAAKLAEGEGAIDELVRLWRDITGNESIYVRSPHLTRLLGDEEVRDACGFVSRNLGGYSALGWFSPLFRLSFQEADQWPKIPSVPQKIRETLMDINALDGLQVQRGLAQRVSDNLSTEAVARSGIKLRLSATERVSGDLRYFTENGDIELLNGTVWQRGRADGADLHEDVLKPPTVADAVMASSAIPIFFSPWHVRGGEAYWDGAVREGIPIHKALELGATDLIAILTGPRETPTTSGPKKYTLTIEKVGRPGKRNPDDESSGDYYARVKWGHHHWRKTNYYENHSSVSPNWRFEDVFGEILIEIKDYNSLGEDNVCDASPAHGDNRDESWQDPRLLKIDFDPRRVTDARNPGRFPIQGDGQGQIGDLITVAGEGESDPVEVSLRIRPGTSGSSGYTKGMPGDLAPLSQAMMLWTHQGSEVSATDLSDLDQLDVLHQVAAEAGAGTVLRAIKSFPLPRDFTGRAYMIPNYVLIEPPFVMGELQEFDPEAISFNIELGDTVARWSRVDFLDRLATRYDADGVTPIPTQRPEATDEWLEQQKRAAIMGLITSRIDTWRSRELADGGASPAGENARCWRAKYEDLQAKANDVQIRPPRRSPRAGVPERGSR